MGPSAPPHLKAVVLTLFPEMLPGPLGLSLAGRALESGLWALETVDIRDFARDKHRTVDDAPFGGGPGMVMCAEVVAAALESVLPPTAALESGAAALIHLTPRGQRLDQALVRHLAGCRTLVLLCGRFEGIDARVIEAYPFTEISLGDFVLSGGEPAAIALLDACVRRLEGVAGRAASVVEESFEDGLLEYPHYTRPEVWRGRAVPGVLLSGDHGAVRTWRRARAEEETRRRRPDLWAAYAAHRQDERD